MVCLFCRSSLSAVRQIRNRFILRSGSAHSSGCVVNGYYYTSLNPFHSIANLLLLTLGMDQCMLKYTPTPQTLSFPLNLITRHLLINVDYQSFHEILLSLLSTLLNVNFFQFHTMPADSDYLYLLKQLWERFSVDSIQAALTNISYNCRTMKANRQSPNTQHQQNHFLVLCIEIGLTVSVFSAIYSVY